MPPAIIKRMRVRVPRHTTSVWSAACFLPWKPILSFIYKLFTAESASREFSLINKSAYTELNPESRTVALRVPSRWICSQMLAFHGSEAAPGSFGEEFTTELKSLIKN